MIRQIIIWPDKRLTQLAEPVTEFNDELKQLADDLVETMVACDGKGLAATQVGVMKSVIVVSMDNKPTVFVNPAYSSEKGEKQTLQEGCLSVPNVFERIERLTDVRVIAQDVLGNDMPPMYLKGYDAVAVQHECDHLEGKMFTDYISSLKRSLIKSKMKKYKR